MSMSSAAINTFEIQLKALARLLDMAEAHATAKKFDVSVLLNSRLAPDMLPLTKQIQIACDFPKGAMARLAGQEPPAWEDTEVTFEELKARIEKTIAFVEGIDAGSVDGQEDRDITLVRRGVESVIKAQAYLLEQALPNFFFHITTAYAILRHNGVEIGKKNFLGTA